MNIMIIPFLYFSHSLAREMYYCIIIIYYNAVNIELIILFFQTIELSGFLEHKDLENSFVLVIGGKELITKKKSHICQANLPLM